MRASTLEPLRLFVIVVALLGIGACAAPLPQAAAPAAESGVPAAKAPATCDPDPYCYRDCLRGYQPGYCRFKCGC